MLETARMSEMGGVKEREQISFISALISIYSRTSLTAFTDGIRKIGKYKFISRRINVHKRQKNT